MTKSIPLVTTLTLIAVLIMVIFSPIALAREANEVEQEQETVSQSFDEKKRERLEEYKLEAEKMRLEIQEKAKKQVEDAKKATDAKKLELRQKSCQARAEALKNKISATSAAAQRHQEKIDSFNQKVTAFVTKYNLTVENYDTLTAVVAQQAAQAQQAVKDLSGYSSDIDCSNVDAATEKVIAYKALLESTKDSLKTYRSATKDLLVAVKTAAETALGDDSVNTSAGAN